MRTYDTRTFIERVAAVVPLDYERDTETSGGWSFHVKDNWVAMTLL